MKKIAKFEKVSFSQFLQDWQNDFTQTTEKECEEIYNAILLPSRATKGSAGYDFFSPISFTLAPHETLKFPTGIRVKIEEGWTATTIFLIMRDIFLPKLQMTAMSKKRLQ